MVPCRACGAANPSGTVICVECGAPLTPRIVSTQKKKVGSSTDSTDSQKTVRRAELQVLEDCFNVCVEKNRGGGAIIVGEPGMGTTTLLKAFSRRLAGRIPSRRIHYVLNREVQEPLAPLRGIVRQALDVSDADEPMTQRLRLTGKVGKVLGPGSAALVTEVSHLLGYLAGVAFPQSPVLRSLEGDVELMNKRIKETLVRYFSADIGSEPAVFIFDDIQKVPDESQAFILDLMEELRTVPLVTVVGGRPEVLDITDNPNVVRVTLESLGDEVMRSLFGQFMPRLEDPPEELIDATVGRAAGNPGSLHELTALLTETGVVDTEDEVWTADIAKLAAADMPVNLLDALKARVEQLDPRDKLVLQHAATVGDVFWDETIVSLTRRRTRLKEDIGAAQIWADDSDTLTITSSLDRLVERQFVVQLPDTDVAGSISYAFARSGIRLSILDGMEKKVRERSHFLVAQWLFHAANSDTSSFAEIEADQWKLARRPHRAGLAYFRAARYARSRYLNQKAIKLFETGLKTVDKKDALVLVDAYHDLGSVYELLGQYEEAERYLTEMVQQAWILNHRGKAGAALNKIGRLYRARGDMAAARAFINRGMTLFKAANDRRGMAACLGDLGELARRQGSYDRAFKLVTEALELQRAMDNRPSVAVSLHTLGHIEAARGSYPQAERYLEEALGLRRDVEDKGGMAQTLSTLAIVLFNRGDLERAIARWEAALGLAEEVGDRRLLAIVYNNLGEAHRDQGNLEAAMHHFKSCQDVVTTLDDRLLQSEVERNIGILAQKMNDSETARVHLERALELAKDFGGKDMIGLAYRALGDLAATTMWDTSNVDGVDEAEKWYRQALEILESIGNDFEIARTQHSLGNRLLERGDMKGGKAVLEAALDIFQRIESKAGDSIARTIREIIGDSGAALVEKAPKKTTAKSLGRKMRSAIKNPIRSVKETFPDMTDELEDIEEE
jgi:predicted ATPase